MGSVGKESEPESEDGVDDTRERLRRAAVEFRNCVAAHSQESGESEPELLGDDHLHDLIRAGKDALHPRVHVGARNLVFEHVAVAAEEL